MGMDAEAYLFYGMPLKADGGEAEFPDNWYEPWPDGIDTISYGYEHSDGAVIIGTSRVWVYDYGCIRLDGENYPSLAKLATLDHLYSDRVLVDAIEVVGLSVDLFEAPGWHLAAGYG